ncbi:MAG: hypothetical protein QG589_605 [Patescibacteria group bacterium]|nr:hypothetical protein [Patescibacteria group bacterium]
MVSEEELLGALKKTRLKGFGNPEIYKDSFLGLRRQMDTNLLVPPQRYVLKPTVNTILSLADEFASRDVDIFDLYGAVLFWLEGSNPDTDNPIPLLPPIVEESFEKEGRIIWLINDGMHRVSAARARGRSINVICITNVPREYPYYAYGLPDGWAGVEEISELTDGYKKKDYRNPDNYKALFRDFNGVFPGVQAERKKTQLYLKE